MKRKNWGHKTAVLTLGVYLGQILGPIATSMAASSPTPASIAAEQAELQQYQQAEQACEGDVTAQEIAMVAWGATTALCGYNCYQYFSPLKTAEKTASTAVQSANTAVQGVATSCNIPPGTAASALGNASSQLGQLTGCASCGSASQGSSGGGGMGDRVHYHDLNPPELQTMRGSIHPFFHAPMCKDPRVALLGSKLNSVGLAHLIQKDLLASSNNQGTRQRHLAARKIPGVMVAIGGVFRPSQTSSVPQASSDLDPNGVPRAYIDDNGNLVQPAYQVTTPSGNVVNGDAGTLNQMNATGQIPQGSTVQPISGGTTVTPSGQSPNGTFTDGAPDHSIDMTTVENPDGSFTSTAGNPTTANQGISGMPPDNSGTTPVAPTVDGNEGFNGSANLVPNQPNNMTFVPNQPAAATSTSNPGSTSPTTPSDPGESEDDRIDYSSDAKPTATNASQSTPGAPQSKPAGPGSVEGALAAMEQAIPAITQLNTAGIAAQKALLGTDPTQAATCQKALATLTTANNNLTQAKNGLMTVSTSIKSKGKICNYMSVGSGVLDITLGMTMGKETATEGIMSAVGAAPGVIGLLKGNQGANNPGATKGAGVTSCFAAATGAMELVMKYMSMNSSQKCVQQQKQNISNLESASVNTQDLWRKILPLLHQGVDSLASCVFLADAVADSNQGFVDAYSACRGDLSSFSSRMACGSQGDLAMKAVSDATGGSDGWDAMYSTFEQTFGLGRDAFASTMKTQPYEAVAALMGKDDPTVSSNMMGLLKQLESTLQGSPALAKSSPASSALPARSLASTGGAGGILSMPDTGPAPSAIDPNQGMRQNYADPDPTRDGIHVDASADLFQIVSQRYQKVSNRM